MLRYLPKICSLIPSMVYVRIGVVIVIVLVAKQNSVVLDIVSLKRVGVLNVEELLAYRKRGVGGSRNGDCGRGSVLNGHQDTKVCFSTAAVL